MTNPIDYQQSILESYKATNEHNLENIKSGTILGTGELVGPYTTSTSYFMEGGTIYTIISASSLHWVPMPLNVY